MKTTNDFKQSLDVNLTSAFLTTQAELFAMIENKFGRIINISSVAAQLEDDLEIHGIKQKVSFPFNFSGTDNNGLFTGSFQIDRDSFHIRSTGKKPDLIKIPVTGKKAG